MAEAAASNRSGACVCALFAGLYINITQYNHVCFCAINEFRSGVRVVRSLFVVLVCPQPPRPMRARVFGPNCPGCIYMYVRDMPIAVNACRAFEFSGRLYPDNCPGFAHGYECL